MKKTKIMFLLCLFVAGMLAGCAGVADSYADRQRRYNQIADNEWRQAVDDWDYLWLRDKNSKLNKYHTIIGS